MPTPSEITTGSPIIDGIIMAVMSAAIFKVLGMIRVRVKEAIQDIRNLRSRYVLPSDSSPQVSYSSFASVTVFVVTIVTFIIPGPVDDIAVMVIGLAVATIAAGVTKVVNQDDD